MGLSVTLLALQLAFAPEPAESAEDQAGWQTDFVSRATSAERIGLPPIAGPLALKLDALAATVELHVRDARVFANRLGEFTGSLCPKAEIKNNAVLLRCRSRRIEASLVSSRGRRYVDLRELRGLPWKLGEDGPPQFFYDPVKLQIGTACPSNSPAGRGECALLAGRNTEAARHFREALTGPDRGMAAVRLGDLALRSDDPILAAGWYQRATGTGNFSRLAAERLCEVMGTCLGDPSTQAVFDTAAMSEPMRTELELRAVRSRAFQDNTAQAAAALLARINDAQRAFPMAQMNSFCRRIALEAMRAPGLEGKDDVLSLYLAIPGRNKGLYAIELAEWASRIAADFGAPTFAGNLVSSVTASVPQAQLTEHLLRAAEFYNSGGDTIRASVIVDFARTRLVPRQLGAPRWAEAIRRAANPVVEAPYAALLPSDDPTSEVEIAREIAAAVLASARAVAVTTGRVP